MGILNFGLFIFSKQAFQFLIKGIDDIFPCFRLNSWSQTMYLMTKPPDQSKMGKKHDFNSRSYHNNLFYQMTLKQYDGSFSWVRLHEITEISLNYTLIIKKNKTLSSQRLHRQGVNSNMKRQRKVNNIFYRKANFSHIRKPFLGILGRLEGLPSGVKVYITFGSREWKSTIVSYSLEKLILPVNILRSKRLN